MVGDAAGGVIVAVTATGLVITETSSGVGLVMEGARALPAPPPAVHVTVPWFEISRSPLMKALAWTVSAPVKSPVYVKVASPFKRVVPFRVCVLAPNTWSETGRFGTGLPTLSRADTVKVRLWPWIAPGTLNGVRFRLAPGGSGVLRVLTWPAMRVQEIDSLPRHALSNPWVLRTWLVSVIAVVTPPLLSKRIAPASNVPPPTKVTPGEPSHGNGKIDPLGRRPSA